MTSREIIANLFDKKPVERIGIFDNIWGDTLKKWTEQGYPTRKTVKKVREEVDGREREVEKEVDDPVDPVDHFGFDLSGVGGWFEMMPLRGVRETIEETDQWRITRNGAGAALKYWKNKSGTPEHIDFRMTSPEVWRRDYRPHLIETDRERLNTEAAAEAFEKRRRQELWAYFGHLFIWENMRQSMGDICMYESLVLEPEWIHDYNRVYTDFYKRHYKLLFEAIGLPNGIWMYEDLGYNKGLFCSPGTLEELIFPYYREVIEFFHSYGLPVVLHTCGRTTEALPLIVECGFDGLNPMEVAAGNDLFSFAEEYGDRLVFFGGFDKRILETHDKDLIRNEVKTFINGMKARDARFVFGSDHSISTNTNYEDFTCMIDAYRDLMIY